ncbi:MAG: repeat containing protein [Flavipsychrobacter sp.]|nr:repeat containing protein [Flavipsychrobacter sp.]
MNYKMFNISFLLVCIAFLVPSQGISAQILTTVAGNGATGSSGDGGLATAAQLNKPWSIVIDSKRNLYVTELGSSTIRKVDSNGIIRRFAGNGTAGFAGDGGPASNAQLNKPRELVVDTKGYIYNRLR